MICLTVEESEAWFKPKGISIKNGHDLDFGTEAKLHGRHIATYKMPANPEELARYIQAIVGWLPNGGQRLLWLKSWHTYPVSEMKFVETIRRGSGEVRPIIETPAHLFESTEYKDYESRTPLDENEEAIMSGLALVLVCFDWNAYLLAQNHSDYIYLADGCAYFSSTNSQRIEDMRNLRR